MYRDLSPPYMPTDNTPPYKDNCLAWQILYRDRGRYFFLTLDGVFFRQNYGNHFLPNWVIADQVL